MVEPPIPLTAFSEDQRAQAHTRFAIIRPTLEDGVTQAIELLILDEANRLKDAGLELIRDFADRGEFDLVLLGMPGLENRLMRAHQLYSRIGFAHELEPESYHRAGLKGIH